MGGSKGPQEILERAQNLQPKAYTVSGIQKFNAYCTENEMKITNDFVDNHHLDYAEVMVSRKILPKLVSAIKDSVIRNAHRLAVMLFESEKIHTPFYHLGAPISALVQTGRRSHLLQKDAESVKTVDDIAILLKEGLLKGARRFKSTDVVKLYEHLIDGCKGDMVSN